MSPVNRWSTVLLFAYALLAGCYDESEGQAKSGNTNWLTSCVAGGACGSGATCVCGVCTRSCELLSDCPDGSAPVECVDPADGLVVNQCAASFTQQSAGVCLRSCAADSDCEADLSCQDGACVGSASSGPPRPDAGSTSPRDPPLGEQACDAEPQRCSATSALRAVIEQSRNASLPADPAARVWSCEAGALRIDPAGYDEAFALTVAGDSLLVAGVATAGGDGAWRIERRLSSDLSPVLGYGVSGVISAATTTRWDAASALVSDGEFVYVAGVAGHGRPAGGRSRVEKRRLDSGRLVYDFGVGGAIERSASGMPSPLAEGALNRALAIDASHVYLSGAGFAVEKRLASDGSLVASFGENGVAEGSAGPDAVASALVLRGGVLYAAGFENTTTLKLQANDAASGDFLYAASAKLDEAGCTPQRVALATSADDDLYLGAMAGTRWLVERRDPAQGALVYRRELPPSGSCDAAGAVVLGADAMYVAGRYDDRWRIEKRRLDDGELVAAFGDGGVVAPGLRGAANAIALRDGVLYVAGIEGPREGVQSSVWRIERRRVDDGSLIDCPAAAPELPRAPECAARPVVERAAAGEDAACEIRVASSSACAAGNVRADAGATPVEDWLLPEGAVLADDTFAKVAPGSVPSSVLLLRGFGFDLPEAARVLGITIEVSRASTRAMSIADHSVHLVRGGHVFDADRSRSVPWQASPRQISYGGANDLWERTWTAAELNDPSFGVALRVRALQGAAQGEAHLGAVRVRVHYCE